MSAIRMKEQTAGTVLVSRTAANGFSDAVRRALTQDPDTVEFDFTGIRVLAPSFLDQLLIVTERLADSVGAGVINILFRNCPPGMEQKLSAIGRAHDADVAAQDDATWLMRRFA